MSTVIHRALAIRGVGRVILATTRREADDRLIEHVVGIHGASVGVIRGSTADVQSRFIRATEPLGDCLVARVTADDPFKDPELYAQAFDLLDSSGADYVSLGPGPVPLGMDVEVFTSEALQKSRILYPTRENKEHVTLAMATQPEFFRETLNVPDLIGDIRLTVDFEDDITFATQVSAMIEDLGGTLGYRTTIEAAHRALTSERRFIP